MLNKEVIDAVRERKFHIYAVKNVEEGLEILTGMKCGKRTKSGIYPKGTLNRLVTDRLDSLAKGLRKYYGDGEKESSNKD